MGRRTRGTDMKRILDFGFWILDYGRCAVPAIVVAMSLAGCQPSQPAPSGATTDTKVAENAPAAPSAPKKLTIGVMPKLVGIPFFTATEKGAKEAGAELGVEVVFDGPPKNDVQLQVQMIETWIAKGFDAIAVAPNDPDAIAPVLEKARKRGVKVIAWDADAKKDARDFFVNQCTAASVARALMDTMAAGAGPAAKYIIVTGSLTAANQNI
ncbi:MAG: substrate-binding domain-containing protein, partial [Candidatus Hydrogenedentes bacterium]|nr:substrate-binding domain-containing protein [Candidatus Hydrogenedentota bacterium]